MRLGRKSNFNYPFFQNNVVYIDSKYFLYCIQIVLFHFQFAQIVLFHFQFAQVVLFHLPQHFSYMYLNMQPLVPACLDKLLSTVCDK